MPEHTTFVDVFGGSGIVLLNKPKSPIEVYNDIDTGLYSLFSVLRDELLSECLSELCKRTPYSRDEFKNSKILDEVSILENARRSMVRYNQSFSGNGHIFSTTIKDVSAGIASSVRRWQRRINAIPAATNRMQDVIVENADYKEILQRYDTTETLFYCDPPYHMSTRDGKNRYIHEFKLKDHDDFIDICLSRTAKVIVSGYACKPYERFESAGWKRIDHQKVCLASKNRQYRTESLWISPNALTLQN